MSFRPAVCILAVVLGSAAAAATSNADVPACPASLGGYTATVHGNDVVVCATTTAPPGFSRAAACPFTVGLIRVDMATGAFHSILGPCVADPRADGGVYAGTPCYLDSCVAPGTYEYGYGTPPFAGCINEACAGPTSGEWAVVATVTAPPSNCTPSQGIEGPYAWSVVDAGIEDGAVRWSGTCTGPLPGPDGGYCAWEWLDGSAQWAPCPPHGGMLCPGHEADGAVVPTPCPSPVGGGGAVQNAGANAGGASSSSDASPSGESQGDSSPSSDAGGAGASPGGQSHGGGCSMAPAGAAASLAPLMGTALAFGVRAVRRRRCRARARGPVRSF